MAEIGLVIKMPEEIVEWINEYSEIIKAFNGEKIGIVVDAIKNGTPLPKGHGDLIDENDLSLMTVHLIDGAFVCDAPTIIPADKEDGE